MLLPPRVNFTNILQAAFTLADSKSAKKDSQVKQLFALLGSLSVKADHRMFLRTAFFHHHFMSSFFCASRLTLNLLAQSVKHKSLAQKNHKFGMPTGIIYAHKLWVK